MAIRVRGYIGDSNIAMALVDGTITAIFGGLGILCIRRHLRRPAPRKTLIVAAIIAVILGLNAGRLLSDEALESLRNAPSLNR